MIRSVIRGRQSVRIESKKETKISGSDVAGASVTIIAGGEMTLNEGATISAQESLNMSSDIKITVAEGVTITLHDITLEFIDNHCFKSIRSTSDGGLDCVDMLGAHIVFSMLEDCWY